MDHSLGQSSLYSGRAQVLVIPPATCIDFSQLVSLSEEGPPRVRTNHLEEPSFGHISEPQGKPFFALFDVFVFSDSV